MSAADELDVIEGQASIIDSAAGEGQGQEQAGAQQQEQQPGQPEQPTAEQVDMAYAATASIAAEAIKGYLRPKFIGNPRIEEGLAIWDSPMLPAVIIPVLKKYNLSLMNMPPEIVLLGALWKMSSDFSSVMKQGEQEREKKQHGD